MKTLEIKLFSFDELSPNAQERVIERESQRVYNDPDDYTLSECIDSLKAIVSAMGCRLSNWSIGAYNRGNFARISGDDSDRFDGGNKTLALFLRALMRHGYPRPRHFSEMEFTGLCGFTGVCFDDDISEFIWKSLFAGDSFADAIDQAADEIRRIAERDLEYRASRECILDYLDRAAEIYTEAGNEF
jgi:hypothetical protein